MRFLLLHSFLFLSIFINAQDQKAKTILDNLNEAYSSKHSIEISFDLTIKFPEEEAMTYDSHVIQSDKMFVFTNSEHEYYGNKDGIWVYVRAQNEVQINDFDEEEADDYFITPLDLLSQYESGGYLYNIVDERDKELDIEFIPKDEFSDYSKFRITVAPKTNELNQVLAFGKDGSRVSIKIKDVQRGKHYDAAIFQFDKSKYPGVIVEDLRL